MRVLTLCLAVLILCSSCASIPFTCDCHNCLLRNDRYMSVTSMRQVEQLKDLEASGSCKRSKLASSRLTTVNDMNDFDIVRNENFDKKEKRKELVDSTATTVGGLGVLGVMVYFVFIL